MTVENGVSRVSHVPQQPLVNQEQYLWAQKDLTESFRKALPNGFQRFFNFHKVNLKPAFFRELRACYEFAVDQKISKGPLDFANALSGILPKSGAPSEDRRVFNEILTHLKKFQEERDRLGLGGPRPESVRQGTVSVGLPPQPTPGQQFEPEISVSLESLYDEWPPTPGWNSSTEVSDSRGIDDSLPPLPPEDEDENARIDDFGLPPPPDENDPTP